MGAPMDPDGFLGMSRDVVQFVDPTFRADVAEPRSLPTKYSLSELIPLIRGMCGNGPNRAGPDLCSTRAGSEDDDSSN